MKARIIVGPPADCWKCGAMSTRMRVANTHGGYNVTEWCLQCDSSAVRDRAWIPTRGLTSINDLPIKQPRHGYDYEAKLCTVCGEMHLLECHHLAPRANFGPAADRWPTVMVCRSCHEEWHRRMGQPIGNHSPAAILTRVQRCRYCGRGMEVMSASYQENPYCVACLGERLTRTGSPPPLAELLAAAVTRRGG